MIVGRSVAPDCHAAFVFVLHLTGFVSLSSSSPRCGVASGHHWQWRRRGRSNIASDRLATAGFGGDLTGTALNIAGSGLAQPSLLASPPLQAALHSAMASPRAYGDGCRASVALAALMPLATTGADGACSPATAMSASQTAAS
jgi:hypothetical protein